MMVKTIMTIVMVIIMVTMVVMVKMIIQRKVYLPWSFKLVSGRFYSKKLQ